MLTLFGRTFFGVRPAPRAAVRAAAVPGRVTQTLVAQTVTCFHHEYARAYTLKFVGYGVIGDSRNAWIMLVCAWRVMQASKAAPGTIPGTPFDGAHPASLDPIMLNNLYTTRSRLGRALTDPELAQVALDAVVIGS